MNGDKFLIDTNILLYLVASKIKAEDLPEGEFYISFVTELEALSYPSISAATFAIKACLITNDKELLMVREIQTKSIVIRG